MPPSRISRIKVQRNTYTGYSIGSAAVWALILAIGSRRLDPEAWKNLRLACAGWWSGWTSATIARAGYPPPKPLTPRGQRTLANVSLALIAVGLISVIHQLVTHKRAATSAADG
jgi:hypothetical protein